MAESICWDGKAETLELLREKMPEVLDAFWSEGILSVKTLKRVSDKGYVHDVHVVPTGWYVTSKTCRNHGQRYASITPPAT